VNAIVAIGLSDVLGLGILVLWLFLIVLVSGRLAFAGRRRAIRRGTHPLRLLPWYLGGPPKVDVDLPDDTRTDRDRRRHP
jgi:hypothetical protein